MNTPKNKIETEKKFKPATTPMKGITFELFKRVVLHFNFAKSGCWARTSDNEKSREYDWIAIRTKRDFYGHNNTARTLHELVVGPFLIIIGIGNLD